MLTLCGHLLTQCPQICCESFINDSRVTAECCTVSRFIALLFSLSLSLSLSVCVCVCVCVSIRMIDYMVIVLSSVTKIFVPLSSVCACTYTCLASISEWPKSHALSDESGNSVRTA